MSRAAAAMFCLPLLCGTVHPLDADDTITLSVNVEGTYPSGAQLTLKILDLDDNTERLETLSSKNRTFALRKGGQYLAGLKDCPPGFMPEEEFLISTAESKDDLERTFVLNPFEVKICQYDAETQEQVSGGILQLRDESDEELIVFEPQEEGLILDEEGEDFLFEAGASYILAQKESAPGYEQGCEQLLLIPEFMERSDEPLKFTVELDKSGSHADEMPAEPVPFYEFTRRPLPVYTETDPFVTDNVQEVTEDKNEDHDVVNMTEYSAPSSFRIPEVYLSLPQSESTKIENPIERTGFAVRLVNTEGNYIIGATLAVSDENGSVVDQWQSAQEDHVLEGALIRADETYTVHMVKPAEGFSGSVVDIAHTVRTKSGTLLPVIELCDTPVQMQKLQQKNETVKKTVNYALYACTVAAVIICGIIAAVCLGVKKK